VRQISIPAYSEEWVPKARTKATSSEGHLIRQMSPSMVSVNAPVWSWLPSMSRSPVAPAKSPVPALTWPLVSKAPVAVSVPMAWTLSVPFFVVKVICPAKGVFDDGI
jgi:hypothetical protein